MSRTFLFQLDHPAHYHLFINTIKLLREKGHCVHISIKEKDILRDLLNGEEYFVISDTYRKQNIFSIVKSVFYRDLKLYKLVQQLKPDLMVGTSPEIGHIRKFVNTPALFFAEDDVDLSMVMFLAAFSCYPFYDSVVSPFGCNNRIWNKKTVFYPGFHKLAYLHPKRFTPDRTRVDVPETEHFYIIRLAKLAAYHDIKALGITDEILFNLIRILDPFGKVLITSEREIPADLTKYLFRGNINDIHHYLYFSDLYIGDSQSMAVEAAMLGTPGIRYNSFVGKISVLEELEKVYDLTFGIEPGSPENLYRRVSEILTIPEYKKVFLDRREKMLSEKIDVSAFMVWYIENFPQSRHIMKSNPAFADRFR